MVERIMKTDGSWTSLVIRVALALVMFPHGAQKLLGWFGGYGVEGTLQFFGSMGIPSALGLTVILVEFFGSIALLVGAFGRLAALGIGAVMLGAVTTVHAKVGFFMNWSGAQAGEGFEYHLLVLTMVAVLAIQGSGPLSVDRAMSRARVTR